MLRLLMAPSNRVCDAFGLSDEHERGLVRQLVNALLLALIATAVFAAVWVFVV